MARSASGIALHEALELKYGDTIKNEPLRTCVKCKGKGEFVNGHKKMIACICVQLDAPNRLRSTIVRAFGKSIKTLDEALQVVGKKKQEAKKNKTDKNKLQVVNEFGRGDDGRFVQGNQVAVSTNGGRPPTFANPEQMMLRADEYFIYIQGEYELVMVDVPVKDKKGNVLRITQMQEKEWTRFPEPPTITGMALFLGFTSRERFYAYQDKPEFESVVAKIRTRIEYEYEKRLNANNPTGAIFALKNMGWRDREEENPEGHKPPPAPMFSVTKADKTIARSEDEVLKRIEEEEKKNQ